MRKKNLILEKFLVHKNDMDLSYDIFSQFLENEILWYAVDLSHGSSYFSLILIVRPERLLFLTLLG